jgi:hypothetical protein
VSGGRAFINGGFAAFAARLAAEAQQPEKIARIGYLAFNIVSEVI